MARPMRRVVTGHNAQGKSVILSDAPSPHALELDGMPGLALINLWVTDGAPASNAGSADAAARPVVLEPPARGLFSRRGEKFSDRLPTQAPRKRNGRGPTHDGPACPG